LKRIRERVSRGELIEHYEIKRLRKDGKIIDVSLTLSPIKDGTGRIIGTSTIARDITERKRLEEEVRRYSERMEELVHERTAMLSKSEQRYRTLLETSPDAVAVIANFKLAYVNRRYAELLGYSNPDELLGRDPLDFVVPEDREMARTIGMKRIRGEPVPELNELRLQRRDGTIIPVEAHSTVIEFEGRRAILSFRRDVTERKKLEEATHRLTEELTALDATVLGITETTDLPATLRTILERAINLLGVEAGGLYLCDPERQEVRRVVSIKMPVDSADMVLRYGEGAAGIVAKTREPLIIDDYGTWPGRVVAFEAAAQFHAFLSVPLIWRETVTGVINVVSRKEGRRFNHDDASFLSRFASHAAIVVERKKMEDRLRESEDRFRRIAEGIFDPIITLNAQGVTTYASPTLFLMTGYTADQVVGKHFTLFLPPDQHAQWIRNFNNVLGGEMVRAQESKILMADGSPVHVEITISPITGPGGAISGVEAILRDVTERRMLAELKDRFISSVTHELRTPLVSMSGYLDLVMKHERFEKETFSYLEVLRRNTNRLLSLTTDLLDFQRLQIGKLEVSMKPIDFTKLLGECIKEIKPMIEGKRQILTLDTPEVPIPILGDTVRLAEVFVNVLDNAAKFTPDGGRVDVHVEDKGGQVITRVSDSGIGMRSEDLRRVFEPFSNIKKPTYIKGTGLGLSVSKGLIEAHGGTISVESDGEGKGTTFKITLPKQRT
jgi:PAS domain S-box-containing protein